MFEGAKSEWAYILKDTKTLVFDAWTWKYRDSLPLFVTIVQGPWPFPWTFDVRLWPFVIFLDRKRSKTCLKRWRPTRNVRKTSLRYEHVQRFKNIRSTVNIHLFWHYNIISIFRMIPFLEPDYVAEKVVEAVLTNQKLLMMPRLMYFLYALKGFEFINYCFFLLKIN